MFKHFVLAATILAPMAVLGDSYFDWENEIAKASQGLVVCMDGYERSLSGRLPEDEKKRLAITARENCRVLKQVFNITMLTARSNISGFEKPLGDYHHAMLETFEFVVPKQDQSMLSYIAMAMEHKKGLAGARLNLFKLFELQRVNGN